MFTNSDSLSFKEGFVNNKNISICYRDYGDQGDEPILLVQGLGGQLINWPHHLIEFLINNKFRPIVYDNRDTGLSTKIKDIVPKKDLNNSIILNYIKYYLRLSIPSVYTLDDMASDGIAVLDKLRITKSHILGISMGGMIAQLITANQQDRFSSFTLIASTAMTPSPFNGPTHKVRNLLMERSKNPSVSLDQRIKRTKKIFALIGHKETNLNTKEFSNNIVKSIERGGKDDTGFTRQLTAILSSKNRIKKVSAITVPTLIIHGKEDPLIKVSNAFKTQKLIRNSKLKIINDMRHLIEPQVFNQFKNNLLSHLRNNNVKP